MKKLIFLIAALFTFIPVVFAADKTVVNVFYQETCPHCKDLHEYLDKLSEDPSYKDLFEVKYYELSNGQKENIELFGKTLTYFNRTSSGVPFYVIGEGYNFGFSNPNTDNENVKKQFEARDTEIKNMIVASYDNGEKNIVKLIEDGSIEPKTTKRTTQETTINNSNNEVVKEMKKETSFNYTYTIILGVLVALVFVILIFRKKNKNEKNI